MDYVLTNFRKVVERVVVQEVKVERLDVGRKTRPQRVGVVTTVKLDLLRNTDDTCTNSSYRPGGWSTVIVGG